MTAAYAVGWVSEDGQGMLHGGEFPSFLDASIALRIWRRELLAECADGDERAAIDAGAFSVETRERSR